MIKIEDEQKISRCLHRSNCMWNHSHSTTSRAYDVWRKIWKSCSLIFDCARGQWFYFHSSHTHTYRMTVVEVVLATAVARSVQPGFDGNSLSFFDIIYICSVDIRSGALFTTAPPSKRIPKTAFQFFAYIVLWINDIVEGVEITFHFICMLLEAHENEARGHKWQNSKERTRAAAQIENGYIIQLIFVSASSSYYFFFFCCSRFPTRKYRFVVAACLPNPH